MIRDTLSPEVSQLSGAVVEAFQEIARHLRLELPIMPLSRWNESVLRYQFCRSLALADPRIRQFVECGKIDLVLRRDETASFVEFKFYNRPVCYDPYTVANKGYKGGPGPKNLSEFMSCVETLHQRRWFDDLSKFVVLVFADPPNVVSKNSYARQYLPYQHPNPAVKLTIRASFGPVDSHEGTVHGHLFELG